MKVCLIDMGTNSLHAIFAEIAANGSYRVLGREKELIRLGDGTLMTGRLSADAMNTALSAMQRVVHLARHRGMEKIIAVATAAIREAVNGGLLLDRIREQTRVKVKVITGYEEGRLIYVAVKNAVDFSGRNALIVDIGGGSAEIICGNQQKAHWIESLKLGANRLAQLFPFSDPPQKAELEKLEDSVRDKLRPVAKRLEQDARADFVIGSSGTLQNLANMIQADRGEPDAGARLMVVSRDEIKRKFRELFALDLEARRRVKGLDPRRADMILHGLVVLIEIMRLADIDQVTICDKALREGMIYDTIERNRQRLKIEEQIPDIRRRSVLFLKQMCDEDSRHAEQTARLALRLFDDLAQDLGCGPVQREWLEFAALLHDIGYHISYDKHHKHAFYLIMHADMDGFTPDEILSIAWIARLHRRSVPKKGSDEFADIPADRLRFIRILGGMLRVADALDHSHFSLVRDVRAIVKKSQVVVRVVTDEEIQWEIHEANSRKDLLEKVLEREVIFEVEATS